MTTPFVPSRPDGRSRHQVAFDYIESRLTDQTLRPDDIISHGELASEMDVEFPSSAYYQAVAKATVMLQSAYHLSLLSERGAGYRVIQGMAMVDQGRALKRSGARRVAKASEIVRAVDETGLDLDQRVTVRQVKRGLAIIGAILQQQEERIAETERDVEMLKSARLDDTARIRATEQEITNIRDLLRQMREGNQ